MRPDQLLSRLTTPLIDAAYDMRDIITQEHRSPSLDRMRRMRILYWKLIPMVRALADDTGVRSDKDTGYSNLIALAEQIAADDRDLAADLHLAERLAITP